MSRLDQLTKLHLADPSDAFVTYGIAMEHAKAGGHAQAIEWLDKTLSIDPSYCYAFFQKAKALAALGDTDAARGVLDQGIRTATQAGDAHAREELAALMDSL